MSDTGGDWSVSWVLERNGDNHCLCPQCSDLKRLFHLHSTFWFITRVPYLCIMCPSKLVIHAENIDQVSYKAKVSVFLMLLSIFSLQLINIFVCHLKLCLRNKSKTSHWSPPPPFWGGFRKLLQGLSLCIFHISTFRSNTTHLSPCKSGQFSSHFYFNFSWVFYLFILLFLIVYHQLCRVLTLV